MAEADAEVLTAIKATVCGIISVYTPPGVDGILCDAFGRALDDGVSEAKDIAGHTADERKSYAERASNASTRMLS